MKRLVCYLALALIVLAGRPAKAQVADLPQPIQIKAPPRLQKAFQAPSRDCGPILFVHGLDSNDEKAWKTTLGVLRDQYGLGDYVPIDFVLNANLGSTRLADDIVVVEPSIPPDACLFAVNFQNWWNGTDTVFLYGHHFVSGESESNQAAIVKQGVAVAIAIFEILTATGKPSATLVGHSMGGLAIREYLQRREGGRPLWWLDPDDPEGHGVAHVVTYGTPHLGSNASVPILQDLFGSIDVSSEAVRDLRWRYLTSGIGRYLFGGTEGFSAFYYNTDVNADGDESDTVVGVSAGTRDNPQMPLPQNIFYTWLVSNYLGFSGDGLVAEGRAWLYDSAGNPAPRCCAEAYLVEDVFHTDQSSDYATLISVLRLDSGVAVEPEDIPAHFALHANYPNPFNAETTILFDLDQPSTVSLIVYDATGRAVETLVEGQLAPGQHRYRWEATGYVSGVYFYRLTTNGSTQTRAMLLLR